LTLAAAAGHDEQMSLRVGVLDFGFPKIVKTGASTTVLVGERLRDTIDLVERADQLGFTRYWIGEHHGPGMSFGGSPEMLLPVLAGRTESIRVGVGAVLVDYYNPLKVVSSFLLMERLFAGRIDMGICRSRADGNAHMALGGDAAITGLFPEQTHIRKVERIMGFLRGKLPEGDPDREIVASPMVPTPPQAWMCGGRLAGALAARLGTSLCLSHFHHGKGANAADVQTYRASFVPSAECPAPKVALGLCGAVVKSPGDAQAARDGWYQPYYPPNLVGTPAEWKAYLTTVVSTFDVDEIVFLDILDDRDARLWGMDALAEVATGVAARA
jgi:luciferase family oxidoreductase group 1